MSRVNKILSQELFYSAGTTIMIPGKQNDTIILTTFQRTLTGGTDYMATWNTALQLFTLKGLDTNGDETDLAADIYFGRTLRTENNITSVVAEWKLKISTPNEISNAQAELDILLSFVKGGAVLDKAYTLPDGLSLESADPNAVWNRINVLQHQINWGGAMIRAQPVS